MSSPRIKHKEKGPKQVNFYIITISTSRYEKYIKNEPVVDESGDLIKQLMISNGHRLIGYSIVPDSKLHILKALIEALMNPSVDVIIMTGGTGYSTTDVTVETVRKIFDREIEGFGELFRAISYADPEVKSAAYLTKATAGIISNKLVFVLPGSPNAVGLALRELILPELDHMIYLIRGI
jgi:molybdenum cofactor biosynthesis protein B